MLQILPLAAVAVLLVIVVAMAIGTSPAAEVASAAPPPTDEPPITANPFLPERQNISDCLGSLERPGCGSEERGGWRQTLVFVVIGLGLVFVFTMVAREVRRSRRAPEQEAAEHDA